MSLTSEFHTEKRSITVRPVRNVKLVSLSSVYTKAESRFFRFVLKEFGQVC